MLSFRRRPFSGFQISAELRRFLCQHVFYTKAQWDLLPHFVCLQSECVHRLPTFQDGDKLIGTRGCAPSDWTCSIDLRDAYLHVPMHPASF